MAVEVFFVDEIESTIIDSQELEEWKRKVEEGGLEGQKQLCDKSPIPFLPMNEAMYRVYKTLCPERTSVEKYSKSAIPLRVLSLILLAKNEKYFDKIEIWSDYSTPDPIVVGYVIEGYNETRYIIARWGDELKDFPTLQKQAIERWKKEKLVKWKEEIITLQSNIENIETLAEKYFIALQWVS